MSILIFKIFDVIIYLYVTGVDSFYLLTTYIIYVLIFLFICHLLGCFLSFCSVNFLFGAPLSAFLEFSCIIELMYERSKKTLKRKLAKFWDECKLAGLGLVMASRNGLFWAVFIPTFVIFGTLISLLSAGSSVIDLFFAVDFGGKMQILGDGFLSLLGRGRNITDFLLNFSITFLQAALIALLVFVYKHRKKNQKKDSSSAQNAGLAAGLALLGSGCPTCGTTLITPLLTSLFSSGSYAIAGAISGILTFIAYILLLWSLKKVGLEAYAIIKSEMWRKRHEKEHGKSN